MPKKPFTLDELITFKGQLSHINQSKVSLVERNDHEASFSLFHITDDCFNAINHFMQLHEAKISISPGVDSKIIIKFKK